MSMKVTKVESVKDKAYKAELSAHWTTFCTVCNEYDSVASRIIGVGFALSLSVSARRKAGDKTPIIGMLNDAMDIGTPIIAKLCKNPRTAKQYKGTIRKLLCLLLGDRKKLKLEELSKEKILKMAKDSKFFQKHKQNTTPGNTDKKKPGDTSKKLKIDFEKAAEDFGKQFKANLQTLNIGLKPKDRALSLKMEVAASDCHIQMLKKLLG